MDSSSALFWSIGIGAVGAYMSSLSFVILEIIPVVRAYFICTFGRS